MGVGGVLRLGHICRLGHVQRGSLGHRGNGASGMLATRCHQEPTRQKKDPGERPEPPVSPGVPTPLGRGHPLVCQGV